MLLYEKIAFEDSVTKCESVKLKTLLDSQDSNIKLKANSLGVDEREFIRQVRLHAPRFPKSSYYTPNFLSNNVYPTLEKLLQSYPNDFKVYRENCGAFMLDCGTGLSEEELIVMRNQDRHPDAVIVATKKIGEQKRNHPSKIMSKLCVKIVEEEMGKYLEEKLHYLHSFRNDAIIRIGLFIQEYNYPVCYMSFSKIDRIDKLLSLKKSLNRDISNDEVIELSRVYGCGNLPKNSISFLIAASKKYLKGYKYLITAVNINLGFSGNSMISSGFVPYAFRPVNYAYNAEGFYTAKRNPCQELSISPNEMPPNILLVREIESSGSTERLYCKLVQINGDKYSFMGSAIEPEISEIRSDLEKIWDDKTRYHRTDITNEHRPSKGQCGVSSLYLARKLKKQGYSARFCEGDANFEKKDDTSIKNHCWVLLKNYRNRDIDVVIDLTADQNGYSQKIIFKEINELNRQKIKYVSRSEKDPDSINVEHLIARLEYLEKELNLIAEEK